MKPFKLTDKNGKLKNNTQWGPADILAHEYGYLDSKYGLGYSPRPHGHTKEYAAGYQSAQFALTVPVGTYAEKENWGWY